MHCASPTMDKCIHSLVWGVTADKMCKAKPDDCKSGCVAAMHFCQIILDTCYHYSTQQLTLFTIPGRVEGWVKLGIALHVCCPWLNLYMTVAVLIKHICPQWVWSQDISQCKSGMLPLRLTTFTISTSEHSKLECKLTLCANLLLACCSLLSKHKHLCFRAFA